MISFEGLNLFGGYPELLRLGLPMLRAIGAAWRLTPLAREFGVTHINVDAAGRVDFVVDVIDRFEDGDEFPLPLEALVFYATDCLAAPERAAVLARLARNRRRAGPVYLAGQEGRALVVRSLFLRCSACTGLMEVRGAVMSDGSAAPMASLVRCRRCFHWHDVAADALLERHSE
ncbi:MAG TPA: hypothetical protein VNC50_15230 [Planctomycetia bacterium]|nr:hypothetical protein [Planctomycetia bacterium]